MVTVKNLTNSPYDLIGKDGSVRLPAFGEVTGDFSDDYLALLEASMAVKVMAETDAKPTPVFVKEEAPGGDDDLARLRTEYTELTGKKPFGGWGADELQKRIDAALAS